MSENIISLNNEKKFEIMISLLKENKDDELAEFILPWILQQKELDSENKLIKNYYGYDYYQPNGNYFEFLRFLVFKISEKNPKYLNSHSRKLLAFFESFDLM